MGEHFVLVVLFFFLSQWIVFVEVHCFLICLDGGPQKSLDLATFTISEVVCQFLELRIKIKYKKVLSLNLSICD